MSNAQVVALVGPTAAGKSALAMAMARRHGLEVVNADAFCLYRGMDIGTAKPSPEDRLLVPHHLIDSHDVSQTVDVAGYQRAARAAIEDIWSRGRTPLLTGGSGLYVQAVLDDLRFPGTDPQVRQRLEAELEQLGAGQMHERLSRIDPVAAASILPGNGRRIVRALEVNEITGQPFTATLEQVRPWCDSLRIGWDPGVDVVDAAIEARVEHMWQAGLVDEVRRLENTMGRTAASAVGYRQILDALAAGEDPDTAAPAVIVATRRLARRQRRWFRRDANIRWPDSVAQAEQLFATLET